MIKYTSTTSEKHNKYLNNKFLITACSKFALKTNSIGSCSMFVKTRKYNYKKPCSN